MKYLLAITLLFGSVNILNAQQCYNIYYERKISGSIYSVVVKSRLLFNDSISLYYYTPEYGKDPHAKYTSLGEDLIHHSSYYNKNTNELLHAVNLSKKKKYLAVDTLKDFDWVYNSQKKEIEGYSCNLAFTVGNNNDSLVVWYANEIGTVFGPSTYIGLPGVPLEIFDQKNNSHIVATKIEKTETVLVIPTKYKRLTFEEHLKKMR